MYKPPSEHLEKIFPTDFADLVERSNSLHHSINWITTQDAYRYSMEHIDRRNTVARQRITQVHEHLRNTCYRFREDQIYSESDLDQICLRLQQLKKDTKRFISTDLKELDEIVIQQPEFSYLKTVIKEDLTGRLDSLISDNQKEQRKLRRKVSKFASTVDIKTEFVTFNTKRSWYMKDYYQELGGLIGYTVWSIDEARTRIDLSEPGPSTSYLYFVLQTVQYSLKNLLSTLFPTLLTQMSLEYIVDGTRWSGETLL